MKLGDWSAGGAGVESQDSMSIESDFLSQVLLLNLAVVVLLRI